MAPPLVAARSRRKEEHYGSGANGCERRPGDPRQGRREGVLVAAFQSEREEKTRDRAERGSVVRGFDQASVAPKRTSSPTTYSDASRSGIYSRYIYPYERSRNSYTIHRLFREAGPPRPAEFTGSA